MTAHFTIGGHYASFEPEALLSAIPQLDSVVRFEGEDTLVEIAGQLAAGSTGAARRGSSPGRMAPASCMGRDGRGAKPRRAAMARSRRHRLSDAAYTDRFDVGSRGCPWVCSFCSIITFYEGNGTKGRRRRDPVRVVDELEYLHRERGVEVVLWQDDDFLAGVRSRGVGPRVADEAIRRGLHHRLRWKLSCRSDEVKPETVRPLVDAGLTHVYLGVESGDEESLEHLNKRLKPEMHLRARDVLRQRALLRLRLHAAGAVVDDCTVRRNIEFLREFVGDGAHPPPSAGCCRTPARRRRSSCSTRGGRRDRPAGRLHFLDPRLHTFHHWLLNTFDSRATSRAPARSNLLRIVQFQANLRKVGPVLDAAVRGIISANNLAVFDALDDALDYVEIGAGRRSRPTRFLGLLSEGQARTDAHSRLDLGAFEMVFAADQEMGRGPVCEAT